MIDAYGNFYPDWPGQPDPRFNRQPLPGVPSPWQPQTLQQPAQPPAQQSAQQPQSAPQTVTKEIIRIGQLEDVGKYHVTPNNSMIFLTSDEQTFVVKEASADGTGYVLNIYDKRPPAPPAPVFDPRQYLTRTETVQLIQEALSTLHLMPERKEAAE